MKVYLGKSGLNKTWQEPFSEVTKCCKCGGEARIMFVGYETYLDSSKQKYICNIRENGGMGDYWVHDAIACAVYLCANCFETVAILNQA